MESRAGSRYEYLTLPDRRLSQTFERDQHGELDICSDDVLRGLGYKDYGNSSPEGFSPWDAMEVNIDVKR